MAFYDLKKKPALTTKEGEKETLYPSIVYSGTLSAREITGKGLVWNRLHCR